jgi:type IV pilus assembly protein PilE
MIVSQAGRQGQQGFTLIELMLVVVIIAIISAVALPMYGEQVRRSSRNEARSIMMENQLWMEQRMTVNSTYLNNNVAPVLPYTQSPKAGRAKYRMTLTNVTAGTYTLSAIPEQGVDDKCKTFVIDQTGLRSLSGSPTLSVEECWNGK